jgi:phosphate transport system permease protein
MSLSLIDSVARFVLRLIASIAILLVVMIVAFLMFESQSAISELGWRMLTDESWFPAEDAAGGTFGLFPIAMGTLLVSGGSILIAAPIGVASAIFNQYYAPRLVAFAYRRIVELLVGIPSVVFGFWGLVVLCPLITKIVNRLAMENVAGPSLLAAIVIVSLMILPTVMLMSESAMQRVPRAHIEGAAALGMGRLSIITQIVLPQTKSRIVSGIALAVARALGETMAVVMVAGNIVKLPSSLFDPVRTLTANIALEMGYAAGVQRSTLFCSGLILLGMVAVLFACEIVLRRFIWRQP